MFVVFGPFIVYNPVSIKGNSKKGEKTVKFGEINWLDFLKGLFQAVVFKDEVGWKERKEDIDGQKDCNSSQEQDEGLREVGIGQRNKVWLGQHGQFLNEKSNEANVKKDIDDFETINIELERSVAKLLTVNENLNKENEHLKKTYKDLYDSIKKTRVQSKDQNDSLIAQLNKKSIENADLKAQIQEKGFANATLKNELRKLKGTSVDTKFSKPSILEKLILRPLINQSVVRQPSVFKSE
ncbi:hypothetical protein Tco_0232644 [Tanacetum coccineum]